MTLEQLKQREQDLLGQLRDITHMFEYYHSYSNTKIRPKGYNYYVKREYRVYIKLNQVRQKIIYKQYLTEY